MSYTFWTSTGKHKSNWFEFKSIFLFIGVKITLFLFESGFVPLKQLIFANFN
jgi:hypothetical protein